MSIGVDSVYFLEKGGGGIPIEPLVEPGAAAVLAVLVTAGLSSCPGVKGTSSRSSSSSLHGASGVDAAPAAAAGSEAFANGSAATAAAASPVAATVGAVAPNKSVADRGVAGCCRGAGDDGSNSGVPTGLEKRADASAGVLLERWNPLAAPGVPAATGVGPATAVGVDTVPKTDAALPANSGGCDGADPKARGEAAPDW